jgi:hypothetical protein
MNVSGVDVINTTIQLYCASRVSENEENEKHLLVSVHHSGNAIRLFLCASKVGMSILHSACHATTYALLVAAVLLLLVGIS